jgi:hypothetical protein
MLKRLKALFSSFVFHLEQFPSNSFSRLFDPRCRSALLLSYVCVGHPRDERINTSEQEQEQRIISMWLISCYIALFWWAIDPTWLSRVGSYGFFLSFYFFPFGYLCENMRICADNIVKWLMRVIDNVMETIRIPKSLRFFMHGEEDWTIAWTMKEMIECPENPSIHLHCINLDKNFSV